ncbi:MAG: DUF58 domain-containing protein [Firmicutes bacterium]|nr:DUF58 domain-containing protein [Alicyclobacillaceae bacterium]MCL6497827.1 DUF58 domain-containing protein [Bacillota bacterium]
MNRVRVPWATAALALGWTASAAYAWWQGGALATRLAAATTLLAIGGAAGALAPARAVRVERRLESKPLRAGQRPQVTLRTRVPWWWPAATAVVEEPDPQGRHGPLRLSIGWPRGRWIERPYPLPPLPRGIWRLGPPRLEWSDLFGFVVRRASLALPPLTLEVWPTVLPGPAPPWGGSNRAGLGTPRGLRPFANGDRLGQIHWPASAKHGRWLVREFDPAPDDGLWIVLDGRPALPPTWFELAVDVAATLTHWLLTRAIPVGLWEKGSGALVPPATGPAHYRRLMRLLARADALSSGAGLAPGVPPRLGVWVTGPSAAASGPPGWQGAVLRVGRPEMQRLEQLRTWANRGGAP